MNDQESTRSLETELEQELLLEGRPRTIREKFLLGVAKSIDKTNDVASRIIASQLAPGEVLFAYQQGDKRLPFLVRVIPFIPDFLTAPKVFLLAVTDLRLMVIEIGRPIGWRKEAEFKRMAASVPLSEVGDVQPMEGLLTSSILITTKSGGRYRYTDMLKGAAEQLAADLAYVSDLVEGAASEAASETAPGVSKSFEAAALAPDRVAGKKTPPPLPWETSTENAACPGAAPPPSKETKPEASAPLADPPPLLDGEESPLAVAAPHPSPPGESCAEATPAVRRTPPPLPPDATLAPDIAARRTPPPLPPALAANETTSQNRLAGVPGAASSSPESPEPASELAPGMRRAVWFQETGVPFILGPFSILAGFAVMFEQGSDEVFGKALLLIGMGISAVVYGVAKRL